MDHSHSLIQDLVEHHALHWRSVSTPELARLLAVSNLFKLLSESLGWSIIRNREAPYAGMIQRIHLS